jgi:hypothetical protein
MVLSTMKKQSPNNVGANCKGVGRMNRQWEHCVGWNNAVEVYKGVDKRKEH